jgi:hypothetical protein
MTFLIEVSTPLQEGASLAYTTERFEYEEPEDAAARISLALSPRRLDLCEVTSALFDGKELSYENEEGTKVVAKQFDAVPA